MQKNIKRKKYLLGKRGGVGERDDAQHGDKRATTVIELAEGNSSSLPHNVRTMAVDGKHGGGREAEVLDVYQETCCDINGLQETRPSGQSALLQTGYVV